MTLWLPSGYPVATLVTICSYHRFPTGYLVSIDRAKSFCTFREKHQSNNYKRFITDSIINILGFDRKILDYTIDTIQLQDIKISDCIVLVCSKEQSE